MNNYVVVLGSNLPSKFGNSAKTLKKCVDELRSYSSIQSSMESNWYISSSIVDEKEPEKVEDAYEQIFLVLRALAEHDGRIVDYIKCIKTGKKPQKNLFRGKRYCFDNIKK